MVALPAGLRPGQKGNGWALRLADVHFTRPSFLATAQTVLAQQPTPILPDPKLTPGDTFDVTAEDVCVPGYAKKVRAVPAWLKRQAYAEYGITQYKTGDYEVDHLIPLSLGGSNSIRNLWPQSSKTSPWNSYVKDALERKLHSLVCAGELDLKPAQREIASNWIEAYEKYVSKSPPTPRVQETKTAPATTANEVWVNTRSGKYWKPGSRFYGKTKEGEFMSESDALDRGYSPAGGTGQWIMPRNQKLTKVIAGRTIKAVTTEPGSVLVRFDDQSSIKIKTTGPATIAPGGRVKSVHEAKAELRIEFEDGSSTTVYLAAPGSSVAVRDKNSTVEYLG